MIRAVLVPFLRESLGIEGIHREPTDTEVLETIAFLRLTEITVPALVDLVAVYAPGHRLRDKPTLNVRVGNYVAPKGGKDLVQRLEVLLSEINHGAVNPWRGHVAYEMLHPFTDGNGRSGRALWAWHMLKNGRDPFGLSFLHRFYYQTLENSR
jgi:Fic/DOC family protein